MAGSFSAKVSDWARQTPQRIEAVYKESAQRVIAAAQLPAGQGGNMPVDTGYLRASLVVSLGLDLPSQTDKPEGPASFTYAPSAADLAIANADIGTPITAAWTANYAKHVEYGARGRAGRRFVALAAQRWQQIVTEVALEAQSRAGG